MKKTIISLVMAICLVIPCMLCFTGCNGGSLKTMDVSVNPEMSFVVDKNNKVVNVVFENQDAGTIYANVNFAGMDVESALKIVVEQSVISGHFELTGDEVEVDVSGSVSADIEKLQTLAKAKIEEVCQSLGVQVTVTVEELSATARKSALVAKALILAPEKTQEELEALSEKELVELIKDKQEELKGLAYDQVQNIKAQFNNAENQLLEQIKNLKNTLKTKKAELQAKRAELEEALPALKPTIEAVIEGYESAIDSLVPQIENALSQYQTAKQNAINSLKAQYETAKDALVNAYKNKVEATQTTLTAHLDAKLASGTITQEQYDYWVNLINSNKN